MMGSLKDNLERHGINPGGGGQDTFIMVVNNSVARGESIYSGIDISGQDFSRFAKRRPKQVLRQGMTSNETIDPLAGVVGMELDDPAEMLRPQFVLEDLDFG